MTEVKIRFGKVEDAAMLAELGAHAFYQAFAAQNTEENMAQYLKAAFSPEKQAEELAQPGSLFLIAEIEGQPVGYTRLLGGSTETCLSGKNPMELVRIYVLQDWKGKGVGARLMQTSIETARANGHDVLWLGVWKLNEPSIAFYKRWGFQPVGTHIFQVGDDPQEDWVMELRLDK